MGDLVLSGALPRQHPTSDLERAIAQTITQTFNALLSPAIEDLVNYGCPHLGSRAVIERFSKQDGLAVLRRPSDTPAAASLNDTIMRVIYANWSSLASERGLGFLRFVLQMLWPNQWSIVQLWHSIEYKSRYPRFLHEDERNTSFLTSRIRVRIADTVDRAELSEFAPILRRLVPAHIVPQVTIDAPTQDNVLTAAVAAKVYQVMDLSPVF